MTKRHIRQTQLRPFLVRNAKGILCFAVVEITIELHRQVYATAQGVLAKITTRDKASIYANTRPGRPVKGNLMWGKEAMSKWTDEAEDMEGDTDTEIGEPSGGGNGRELRQKGNKTAEEELGKPFKDIKRRRIGEIPQLAFWSKTDTTSDDKSEAKEAATIRRHEAFDKAVLVALELSQEIIHAVWSTRLGRLTKQRGKWKQKRFGTGTKKLRDC